MVSTAPCKLIIIKNGSTQLVIIVLIPELEQESLVMSVFLAKIVISGSDLAQEDNTMIVIRVETRLHIGGVHTYESHGINFCSVTRLEFLTSTT